MLGSEKCMNKLRRLVFVIAIGFMGVATCNYADAASPLLVTMKQVGFSHIEVPDNICNDEVRIKSIYFKVKEEARRIKKVNIDYTGKNKDLDDCFVDGYINKYEIVPTWLEPTATSVKKEEWKKEYKWNDDKGKEHTATRTRYTSEPLGVPGRYVFTAHVQATLNLVSSKTGQILVSYTAYDTDKSEMKAFERIVKEFYKKINKSVKESKKMYKE